MCVNNIEKHKEVKMPVAKISGVGHSADALLQHANKLGKRHAELKKNMKESSYYMINDGLLAGALSPFIAIHTSDHPYATAIAGIAAILCSIASCVNLGKFIKAYKENKKIKHEMEDLMNNSNLMETVKQNLGIEGGAELPKSTKEALKYFSKTEIYA
jgi:hypothetical protein